MDIIYLLKGRPENCKCGEKLMHTMENIGKPDKPRFMHRIYCPDMKDRYPFDTSHDMYLWIDDTEKED